MQNGLNQAIGMLLKCLLRHRLNCRHFHRNQISLQIWLLPAGFKRRCESSNNMNAFKAYKACTPISWSPNPYITLGRGIPGTRRLHRHTLEALRLQKCNRTVMRWNTPTVRGMLQQVKRLVVTETEEMYKARKQKDANHQALRPPLVVNHLPSPASDSS